MLTSIIYLAVGSVMLYFGSEWIVKGGVSIADRLGISPLVIGLTIVAFGTSLPELIVPDLSFSPMLSLRRTRIFLYDRGNTNMYYIPVGLIIC